MSRLVSVVIPVLDDFRIFRTLESVSIQTIRNLIEVIVTDGGSEKPLVDRLLAARNSGLIQILDSRKDSGIFDALNRGLDLATGQYIAMIGSDDYYAYPGAIEDLLVQTSINGSDGCYGDIEFFGRDGSTTRRWIAGPFSRKSLGRGWMPPHFGLLLHRRVYEQTGRFDLRFRVAADYDFMLRALHGTEVCLAYLPRTVVRMEQGGNSNRNLKQILLGNWEVSRSWRKHGLGNGVIPAVLKVGRKVGQLKLFW